MQNIERVVHDLVVRVCAAVLQGLERWPPVRSESHDLPIQGDLPGYQARGSGCNAWIHAGQVLVISGADLYALTIFDEQRAVAIPLHFVEPLLTFGQVLNELCRHGRDEGGRRT